MESYLMITQLNDFIFCPRSIYFSGIYRESVSDELYHQTPQREGLAHHAAIDENRYSSRNDIITGLTVYSEKYHLLGRIDIFDKDKGILTERKYSITAIYPGFRYQLYAQYFALTEMGFTVKQLRLYSKKDNKVYPIPLPGRSETDEFEKVIAEIRNFSLSAPVIPNAKKCSHCIYNQLCDQNIGEEESYAVIS